MDGFLFSFLSLDDAGMRWAVFVSLHLQQDEILSCAIPASGEIKEF
jgi:hypothetical protein